MPRTGIEPARITPHAPQTCASTNSATWAKTNLEKNYLFAFALVAVFADEFDMEVSLALVAPVFAAVFVFKFVIVSDCAVPGAIVVGAVGEVVCRTEIFPVSAGIDSIKAVSIKTVAAVIVTFDKIDCVPRGPKAVLEILLVNKAPASVFPGWSKIVAIKTMQDMKNNPYKK
jgi:hypothetical protein